MQTRAERPLARRMYAESGESLACRRSAFSRYRQTVTWDRFTLSNLSGFKKLHGGIAALNGGATWGSVPVLVT